MSASIPGPFVRRLRFTPLGDLLRGRISGRLDWRGRIAAIDLPEALKDHVFAVVNRTKLWRGERSEVAGELIAHFHDGLAAGESAEALIADFGDIRTAAKLIRRAKRRQRSLFWQAWTWIARGLLVLAVIYIYFVAAFFIRRPVVSVDYLAKLNAPTLATPESDRAWPIYRRAVIALGQSANNKDKTLERWLEGAKNQRTVLDATPADPEWGQLTAWLDAHREGLALLREAADKPDFGFILGPSRSENAPDFPSPSPSADVPVFSVLLPDVSYTRFFIRILVVDARYTAVKHDGERVFADLNAALGIISQMKSRPFIASSFARVGTYAFMIDFVETLLAQSPVILTDSQLVSLAHRIGSFGGDSAGSLIDLKGERFGFYDIVQRSYSDDGHGNGRLTRQGMTLLAEYGLFGFPISGLSPADTAVQTALTSAASVVGTRRDVLVEYDRLMDLVDQTYARPLRDWSPGGSPLAEYERRAQAIAESPLLTAKYLPIKAILPAMQRVGSVAEQVIGSRDGVVVGIALELYRRRHGSYPATLDALVPNLLPAVPLDRIDGQPLRYRLIDGRPVVYSVGVDRDDDAGRPPLDSRGQPQPWQAAQWPVGTNPDSPRLASMYAATPAGVTPDGDWPVYDARPQPAPATRPAN